MADGDAPALFLSIALWGNRMDLSLWPADAGVASSADAFNQVLSNAQLLVIVCTTPPQPQLRKQPPVAP